MAAGTASGGRRIIKTLGRKVTRLQPVQGFAADMASASVLMTTASFGCQSPRPMWFPPRSWESGPRGIGMAFAWIWSRAFSDLVSHIARERAAGIQSEPACSDLGDVVRLVTGLGGCGLGTITKT